MKIEWLNDEMTEARLIRGWFRKQHATVKLTPMRHVSGNYWAFAPSGDEVGDSIRRAIEHDKRCEEWRRKEAIKESNWQPLRSLPSARVVTK
jgi:hypothetical protein